MTSILEEKGTIETLNTEQAERLQQFRDVEMQVLTFDARSLLIKSKQNTDEMME